MNIYQKNFNINVLKKFPIHNFLYYWSKNTLFLMKNILFLMNNIKNKTYIMKILNYYKHILTALTKNMKIKVYFFKK